MRWQTLGKLMLLALLAVPGLAQPQAGRAPVVEVGQAEVRPLSSTTLVPGTVVSRNDADIAAEVEGRLVSVAEVGTSVAAGEAVARIEDTALRLRHDELVAEVARAQARLTYLESDERRFARLAKDNLAAAQQLELTRADRDVAAADLSVAQARLAQNEDRLARTVLEAPFAGVVVERRVMPGERVGEGTDVVRLVDQRHLEVIARSPLEYFRHVTPGEALPLSGAGVHAEGTVRAVIAVGDENTHQFELRIDIEPDMYPVGQTLRVEIPTSDTRQVLVVHRDALVLRPEGISVFVVDEGETVRQVSVTTGMGSGDYIEIVGAVEAGDRVVVRGNERLQPGQTVDVSG